MGETTEFCDANYLFVLLLCSIGFVVLVCFFFLFCFFVLDLVVVKTVQLKQFD